MILLADLSLGGIMICGGGGKLNHTHTRTRSLIGDFFAKLVCAYLSGGFIDKHLKLKKKEKSSIRSVNLCFGGWGEVFTENNLDYGKVNFVIVKTVDT